MSTFIFELTCKRCSEACSSRIAVSRPATSRRVAFREREKRATRPSRISGGNRDFTGIPSRGTTAEVLAEYQIRIRGNEREISRSGLTAHAALSLVVVESGQRDLATARSARIELLIPADRLLDQPRSFLPTVCQRGSTMSRNMGGKPTTPFSPGVTCARPREPRS